MHAVPSTRTRMQYRLPCTLVHGTHLYTCCFTLWALLLIQLRLSVVLMYENGEKVKNQNVLALKKIELNSLSGMISCALRILDVSKKHLSQRFRVEIGPSLDSSPANCDISGAVSRAVEVRSKQKRDSKRTRSRNAETEVGSAVDYGSVLSSPELELKRPRLEAPSDSSQSAVLSEVANWCRTVAGTLAGLEWILAGYEMAMDGSNNVDGNKPIHRCPACWAYRERFRPPHALPTSHYSHCRLAAHLSSFNSTINAYLSTITPTHVQAPLRSGTTQSSAAVASGTLAVPDTDLAGSSPPSHRVKTGIDQSAIPSSPESSHTVAVDVESLSTKSSASPSTTSTSSTSRGTNSPRRSQETIANMSLPAQIGWSCQFLSALVWFGGSTRSWEHVCFPTPLFRAICCPQGYPRGRGLEMAWMHSLRKLPVILLVNAFLIGLDDSVEIYMPWF